MHSLIAVIAATLQPDAVTKMGVGTRDAGLFRDMLCAKVVSHGQARATAFETNLDIVGAPIQSKVRLAGKIGNQDMSAAKSIDSNPGDKGKPISPAPMSTPAPLQLMIPSAMPIHAARGEGRQEVPAAALSDIVGALSAKSSSNTATTGMAKPALDLTIKTLDGTSMPDLKVVNSSSSQSRLQPQYQFQTPSEAALEKSTSFPRSRPNAPLSSTQTSTPGPSLISSSGAAGDADGRVLPDPLADRANSRQRAVGSDQSPVSTRTGTAIPEGRNTASLQDQPTNNADVSSESAAAGVTAPTALPTPAAPPAAAADLYVEANLANLRQTPSGYNPSPVPARTVAAIPEARSTSSWQDQTANNNVMNSTNSEGGVSTTAVPTMPASSAVTAASSFVETNLANLRQKTVGSDQSPLPTRTTTANTGGRSSSLQGQPANPPDVNSASAAGGVTTTAAPPAPTLPAALATSLFVETNPPGSPPIPDSLNSLRKANSTEPGRSDRKADRNLARSSPMATDAQAESQTAPLQSDGPELTVRAGDSSPAIVGIGHNPNPDRTAAATAPAGLDQAAGQTLHASPEGQRRGDAKAQAPSPFPASAAADTTQTAPPVMQSARVLDRMGQSEIRVGLNTADFGNLELHTRVNQDRVAATLATSHSELRAALIAEMPSLEHAMAQHRLTLDSFHLDTHSGAHPNKNQGAPADSQNQSQTWEQAVDPGAAAEGLPMAETVPSQVWIRPYSSGLNVHA